MSEREETNHTPGPWEWIDFGGDWCLCSRTPHVPVVLAGNDSGRITTRDERGILQPITKDHPNARLIAAAPDLLEACQSLLHIFDRGLEAGTIGRMFCDDAIKAVNKALGKE